MTQLDRLQPRYDVAVIGAGPAGLAAGFEHCRRTPISGAPRAPYCMMGVCFECLVTIDGVGNRQGCLVAVREGMRVELQRGKRDPGT